MATATWSLLRAAASSRRGSPDGARRSTEGSTWLLLVDGAGGDEALDVLVGRGAQLRGRAVGGDLALVQQRDHVADAERRRHVVADHDARDVEALLGLLDHVVDVAR